MRKPDKETEKKIIAKIKQVNKSNWDHDIQYIDGKYVEDVVSEYQRTGDELLLKKIIQNYHIFRDSIWAKTFAPYCDNDIEAGGMMYDEIIWKSAQSFNLEKGKKPKGKAFNAYCVSACMNKLKNDWSSRMSGRSHPHVKCPICNEEVYQIDEKHLRHELNLERYKKQYPFYPLCSYDGFTMSPINGEIVSEINLEVINRNNKTYNVEDFFCEHKDSLPKFPVRCPVTGFILDKIPDNYTKLIMNGYNEESFINDYPDFQGYIKCPFTNNKVLTITQNYLDKVLKQKEERPRYSIRKFNIDHPNVTMKTKQVPVINPYTNKKVKEITFEMLAEAGVTLKEHLEDYAEIIIDQWYPNRITCPFTGRLTNRITRENLNSLGKTTYQFYLAVCKYPLKKYNVKCAFCGEWVDNIWSHLSNVNHKYAKEISMEVFEQRYGVKSAKAIVTTNSFIPNDSGETIHIADLFHFKLDNLDPIEMEDSIIAASSKVGMKDIDILLARSLREAKTISDIAHCVSKKYSFYIPEDISGTEKIKTYISTKINTKDFDINMKNFSDRRKVDVFFPSSETILERLKILINSSDLQSV